MARVCQLRASRNAFASQHETHVAIALLKVPHVPAVHANKPISAVYKGRYANDPTQEMV